MFGLLFYLGNPFLTIFFSFLFSLILLEFETLSLFPYELKLISFNLLNKTQKEWIRQYHKTVYSKVSNLLDKKHSEWLKKKIEMTN